MAGETYTVVACIPADLAGDDKVVPLFKAPAANVGGGITLVSAEAFNSVALAGAGTTFTLTLINMGADGTGNDGTIAPAIGSATQWAALTPQAWVLDATEKLVDAGEWIGVHYHELNSANNSIVRIAMQYQMGN